MKLVDAAKAATPAARAPFLMNFELERKQYRNKKYEDEDEAKEKEKFMFSAESDFQLVMATQATKGDKAMLRMQYDSLLLYVTCM